METKKCKACKKVKALDQFGLDKRANDGHASVCLSCKAEASETGNFQEKLDAVVDSMNHAVGDLNTRVTGIEGNISEILTAVKAINNPISIRKGYEAGQDGLGAEHVAEAKEVGGESIIVEPPQRGLDDPNFIDKAEHEKFMHERVRVHISEARDKFDDPSFIVAVNGRQEVFFRNQEKTVKRMFVEGLARARPVHYGNEETRDSQGVMSYRWPAKRALRYPFSVIEDPNPRGREWLSNIMREP